MPDQKTAMSEGFSAARDQSSSHAASEIAAVAAILRDQEETTDADLVRHGAQMRLEALGSATAILLDCGREDQAAIAIAYANGFGKPQEVAHD
ncbi:hypothetical protein [Roseateles saccharophilus]|uniref:Uncharacterized protein n=1 Tax=Roseateles saccharophilus TaxID=304 RepID=A0A4V2VQ37_ROSSA|nr:hypothetical protein [Roseateles saccharophilus]MDG0833454.1 hypothetical protein [Roseateles saccharophilus]TCU93109.1 hypothetical protein EV671_102070 [Roseateles saccharophilus]